MLALTDLTTVQQKEISKESWENPSIIKLFILILNKVKLDKQNLWIYKCNKTITLV